MKLHLPTGLRAALIAAITVVGFTISPVLADAPPAELAHTITLNDATTTTISTGNGKMWLDGGTSLNFDHGWLMEFTIDASTLSSGQGLVIFKAQGSGGLEIYLTGDGTISMTDRGGSEAKTDALTMSYGDKLRAAYERDAGTLYFTNVNTGEYVSGVWTAGGWANIGTYAATFYTNDQVTVTVGDGYDMNGITGDTFMEYATYSASEPTATLTWKGTNTSHVLTSTVWDDGSGSGTPVPYSEEVPLAFGTDGFKTVTISDAAVAKSMEVQVAGYTFENNASLTTQKLTVAEGASLVMKGTGDYTINRANIAAGATLTVNGATTVGVGTLNNSGTLNLTDADTRMTVSDNISIAAGSTFTTTGGGTLAVNTFAVSGGTVTIGSNIEIVGGAPGTGANPRKQGLYITNAASDVKLLGALTNITGAMYANAGTVTVGDGSKTVRVETNRIEFGDSQGGEVSTLNIMKGATVHVKGADNTDFGTTGMLLGEWDASSVANIHGKLYGDNTTAYVGDKQATINIEDGGVMAVKGIGITANKGGKSQILIVNLNDGGKLVLGENGMRSEKPLTATFGDAEVGISSASVQIGAAITMNGTTGTTFNTTVYEWQGADEMRELVKGATGGTLTVSGNITGEGTVIVAGAGELQLTGTANVLTHAIKLTAGTLTMDGGTFDISSLDGGTIEEKGYEDGETEGNGFLVSEGSVKVVDITAGASLKGATADLLYNGSTVHLNNETGAVEMSGKSLATFYVNENGSTEKLSWAVEKAGTELKGVVLDNGTTFALDVEGALDSLSLKADASATVAVSKDASIGTITAPTEGKVLGMTGEGTVTTNSLVGGGTVNLGEKIVLVNNATTAPSVKAVLSGSGTYVLAPQVLNMNSATLGEDWTGTVRISHPTHNAIIDFSQFVKGTNSTLELNGVMGWSSTWSSDTPQNIKLTDNGENQAWVCSGFSQNDYTAIYSGKWSGDGTYVSYSKSGGNRFTNATFTGDIADWEGAFLYRSDAAGSTGNVVFRNSATDVNITIGKDGTNGTLNVKAETGATFSKNVSAEQLIVNAAGQTVTLAGGANLGTATVTAGTLALVSTDLVIGALNVNAGTTLSAADGSSLQSAVTLAAGSTLSVGTAGLALESGSEFTLSGDKINFSYTGTMGQEIIVASGLTVDTIHGISFTDGVAVASDYLTLSGDLASYTQLKVKDNKLVLAKEIGSGSYWGKGIGADNWDLSTENWAKADGDTASGTFTNGSDAYFTANGGGGTIAVTESVIVSVVNVSGLAYSFTGANNLSINGGVNITDSGSATFDQIGTLPLISIDSSSAMTVSSGNVTVQDLSNAGSLTVTAGDLTIGKATTKGGNVTAKNLTLTGENAFAAVNVAGTVSGAASIKVGGTSVIGTLSGVNKLNLADGTLKLDAATGLNETTLSGALTAGGGVGLGSVAMNDRSSIQSTGEVSASGITVTGTADILAGTKLQTATVGGTGTLKVASGSTVGGSNLSVADNATLELLEGSTLANTGTLSVAGKVIAGNGINLGTANVSGTLQTSGGVGATALTLSGGTLTSTGTLTVDNNLTVNGAASVENVVIGGNLAMGAASGALTATGTLDAGTITLGRVSAAECYITANALGTTATDFVVDEAYITSQSFSVGTTITLADLATDYAGTVTVNGKSSFTDDNRRVYTIAKNSGDHDIVLTVEQQESGFVWTGNEDTLWSTSGNWSGGTVPGSEDWVQVKGDTHTIELDVDPTVDYFSVSAQSATLQGEHTLQVGSALEVNVNGILYVGDASAPTAIETPTATINGTLVVQPRSTVQADATTIDGGTLNVNNASYIAETIDMSEGTLRTSSDSSVATGQLNGDPDSTVGGNVTIYGNGGRYTGGYDDAHIEVIEGADATFYAGEGLNLHGDGTAKLQYSGDTAIGGVDAGDLDIILNDPTSSNIGSTLTLQNPSAMEAGSITFGMSAIDSAATINTNRIPVIIDATDFAVGNETTVVVNQDKTQDTGIAMAVGNNGKTRNLVLARVGADNTNTDSVVLNGNLYGKYFKNARIEHGALLVDMNDTYYQTISGATSFNGRAGAGMLDDAFVENNPQISNPTGDLAAVMTALEQGAISSQQADRVLSAMSGASHAAMGAAWSRDVDRQLRAIRNRTTSMGVAECVVNEDMPFINVWINAEGDYTKLNNDGTLAGYKLSSWGGTVGVDVDFTNRFTMGLAVTAMSGDFTACSADNAEGDLDRLYVSVFGRYTRRAWTHTFVATLGMADTKLERTVDYGYGHYATKSESDGMAFGLMYELGYVAALNDDASTCIQPLVNLSYRTSSLGGVTEKSTSDAALRLGDAKASVFTVAAGARLQSTIGTSVYNRATLFEGRVLLKADAGDRDAEASNGFVGVPARRTTKSAKMGAFGVEVGAGITIPVSENAGALFLDFTGDFRNRYTEINGTVGYRLNF